LAWDHICNFELGQWGGSDPFWRVQTKRQAGCRAKWNRDQVGGLTWQLLIGRARHADGPAGVAGRGTGVGTPAVNIDRQPWYVRLAAYVAIVLAITVGVTALRTSEQPQAVQLSTLQR